MGELIWLKLDLCNLYIHSTELTKVPFITVAGRPSVPLSALWNNGIVPQVPIVQDLHTDQGRALATIHIIYFNKV